MRGACRMRVLYLHALQRGRASFMSLRTPARTAKAILAGVLFFLLFL